MANSIDPDQMPHSAASDLGLHCLLGLFVQICRVIMVPILLATNQNNSVVVMPYNGGHIKSVLTQTGYNLMMLHEDCQVPLKLQQ